MKPGPCPLRKVPTFLRQLLSLQIVWCTFRTCLNLLEPTARVLFSICSLLPTIVTVNGVPLETRRVTRKAKLLSLLILIIRPRTLIVNVCRVATGEVAKTSLPITRKFVLWARPRTLIRPHGMLRPIGATEKAEASVVTTRLESTTTLNVLF